MREFGDDMVPIEGARTPGAQMISPDGYSLPARRCAGLPYVSLNWNFDAMYFAELSMYGNTVLSLMFS